MHKYKKLLLVTFAIGSSFVLIAMEGETKKIALERILRSGYIAALTDPVEDEVIVGNYAIDRMQTDIATQNKDWDFYAWTAAQILAGCNIDSLLDNTTINFLNLCKKLIHLLESRHANATDYVRAKAFLQQALLKNRITIDSIETIHLHDTHIALAYTIFYKLAKQIDEPENPAWALDSHTPSFVYNSAVAHLIGFACGALTVAAYTWWNQQETSDTDDEVDGHQEEVSG